VAFIGKTGAPVMIGIITSTWPTVLRAGTRMRPFCNRTKFDTGCDESISVVCIIAILVQIRCAYASETGS
jgi:hypothetical protein